jgi:uncharacterized protein (TIGR01777 family)
MKIAVTGATGFVGSHLVTKLQQQNRRVLALCRNKERGQKYFPATDFPGVEVMEYVAGQPGAWIEAIATCDAVVNLAGEPIADQRWTPERKTLILESRSLGTTKLVEAINQAQPRPQVLVSASAVGYYGTSETAIFDETSPSGNDFLAGVCQAWEEAAQNVADTRLVILRLGIVLGNGGAVAKMVPPFRLFAGGPIGSGKQWLSWIHVDDLVEMICTAIDHPEISGIFNATSPNPLRMADFCRNLGDVLGRPSWLPVPDFVLEMLLGDAAVVVLEGQQVLPKRFLDYGFNFKYPSVKQALAQFL